jgi:hypothetical protein
MGYYMELISFVSVDAKQFPHQYKWCKDHIDPTYIDYDLDENLYSIDEVNDYQGNTPEWMAIFIIDIIATSPNTAYFRFVNF